MNKIELLSAGALWADGFTLYHPLFIDKYAPVEKTLELRQIYQAELLGLLCQIKAPTLFSSPLAGEVPRKGDAGAARQVSVHGPY